MATNRIDRTVRDAQLALELARMKRDTRAEGEALRALQAARRAIRAQLATMREQQERM